MSARKDKLAPVPEPAPTRSDSVAIVDAILSAVVEIDDPDASVNAIAERAGVGVASLYRYFPDKRAIYAELSRRLLRDFLVRVREALEEAATLEAAVEQCCRLAVFVPGTTPTLRRALNLNVPLSWTEASVNTMFGTVVAEMTTWLASRITPVPTDLATRVFVAVAAARGLVMVSRLLPEHAPDDEALVGHMVRVTRAALVA